MSARQEKGGKSFADIRERIMQGAPSMDALRGEGRSERAREDAFAESSHLNYSNRSFTLALLAFMVVALLLVLTMGANVYRGLVESHSQVKQVRLETSLLATSVLMNDVRGSVSRGEGPEGDALVLTEKTQDGTFQTRFYLYEGNLMEEYAVASAPCNPENATVVAPLSRFSFTLEGNLLSITTDAGTEHIALRSTQLGGD